jgi:chromosome partitioning protein
MAIIFSVVNQKGGVLKTTLTGNLGAGLALKGYKVLVCDLDSQCNLTQSLIGDIGDDTNICEMLLNEKKVDSIIRDTQIENLKIVPAGESLAGAELTITNMMSRESILENCLDSDVVNDFDFVLIDNSPSIGLLPLNSLVASHYALIPVSCEYLPLIGLKYIIGTIERVQGNRKLNPNLKIFGYLLTLYDIRESITLQVESILRERFQDLVFKNVVRINTKAKSAPSRQQTIFQYEGLKGRGTEDYKSITLEFIEKLKNHETKTS